MEILKLNRKILKTLGFCASPEESAFHLKIGQWIIAFLQISFFAWAFTTSFLYFLNHFQVDGVQRCILAVGQMFGDIQSFFSIICLFIQAKKIREFYDRIQRVYDQSERTKYAVVYLRVNRFCEQFIKWTLCITVGSSSLGMCFVAVAGISFYYIRDGYVEMKNLFLPWQLELPFDLNTVGGYSGALVTHALIGLIYFTVLVLIESILLTMGLFLGAFHSQYELMMNDINQLVNTGSSDIDYYRTELKTRLANAINFHNEAKEIFVLCCEILRGAIFVQVFLAALLISSLQFTIASGTELMDLQVFSALVGGVVCTGNIFIFCFVGSFVTEKFSCYANTTYETQWYKFPLQLQPYLRLIIADAQRSRNFNGLGIFDLNLALFAQVMRASMSYFLMFKSI